MIVCMCVCVLHVWLVTQRPEEVIWSLKLALFKHRKMHINWCSTARFLLCSCLKVLDLELLDLLCMPIFSKLFHPKGEWGNEHILILIGSKLWTLTDMVGDYIIRITFGSDNIALIRNSFNQSLEATSYINLCTCG